MFASSRSSSVRSTSSGCNSPAKLIKKSKINDSSKPNTSKASTLGETLTFSSPMLDSITVKTSLKGEGASSEGSPITPGAPSAKQMVIDLTLESDSDHPPAISPTNHTKSTEMMPAVKKPRGPRQFEKCPDEKKATPLSTHHIPLQSRPLSTPKVFRKPSAKASEKSSDSKLPVRKRPRTDDSPTSLPPLKRVSPTLNSPRNPSKTLSGAPDDHTSSDSEDIKYEPSRKPPKPQPFTKPAQPGLAGSNSTQDRHFKQKPESDPQKVATLLGLANSESRKDESQVHKALISHLQKKLEQEIGNTRHLEVENRHLQTDKTMLKESHKAELKAKDDKIRTALEETRTVDGARNELKAKNDKLKAGYDNLGAHHDTLKAEYYKLEADRDKIKADRDKVNTDRDKTKAEYEKLEADRDKIKADRDKIKEDHGKLKAEYEKLETDRDKIKAGYDNLEAHHDTLKADHDKFKAEHDKLEADHDKLKVVCDKLKAENVRGFELASKLEQELGDSRTDADKARADLDGAKTAITQAVEAANKAQIENLEGSLDKMTKAHDDLEKRLEEETTTRRHVQDKHRTESQKYQAKIESHKTEISNLKKQHDEDVAAVQTERASLEKSLERVKQDLNQKCCLEEAAQAAIEEQKAELDTCRSEMEQTKKALLSARAQLFERTTERDTCRSENASTEKARYSLQLEISAAQSRLSASQENETHLRRKPDEQSEKLTQQTALSENLQTRLNDSQKARSDLAASRDELAVEIRRAKAIVDNWNECVEEAKGVCRTANVTYLLGKSPVGNVHHILNAELNKEISLRLQRERELTQLMKDNGLTNESVQHPSVKDISQEHSHAHPGHSHDATVAPRSVSPIPPSSLSPAQAQALTRAQDRAFAAKHEALTKEKDQYVEWLTMEEQYSGELLWERDQLRANVRDHTEAHNCIPVSESVRAMREYHRIHGHHMPEAEAEALKKRLVQKVQAGAVQFGSTEDTMQAQQVMAEQAPPLHVQIVPSQTSAVQMLPPPRPDQPPRATPQHLNGWLGVVAGTSSH